MILPFVLRTLDSKSGCWLQHWNVDCADDVQLQRTVSTELPECGAVIDLSFSETRSVAAFFSLQLDLKFDVGELERIDKTFVFNINTHTGRELLLMLNGKKPFSAFVEMVPQDRGLEIIPERFFEPYVLQSMIIKHEFSSASKAIKGGLCRRVMYALPGEEWRFGAYEMLWRCADQYGWNTGFERIEGFLLGYETETDPFFKKLMNPAKVVGRSDL